MEQPDEQELAQFHAPRFRGSRVLVTGGGRGIGAALAEGFCAAGAEVWIAGRHRDALESTASRLVLAGGRCRFVVADVSVEEEVDRLFAEVVGERGVLDVLVNNAGIAGPTKSLEELTLAEWEETLDINLTGVFLCCRTAIRALRRSARGRIINIGSASGKRPLANRSPYCASKLGLVGLSRTLAVELGGGQVTVNVISPFLVAGERLDDVVASMANALGLDESAMRSQLLQETALKRPTQAADVVSLALFLASSGADNITGQDLNVSAGAVMY